MNRNLRRRSEKLARKAPLSAKAQQIYVGALRHHQAGRLDEACDAYKAALLLQPDNAEAHYGFGLALQIKGQPERAIDCYEKAIVHDPRHAFALGNLSVLYRESERLAEAEAVALRSLAVEPASPNNLCNLGSVLIAREEYDRAADALLKALAIDPNHSQSLSNLGDARRRQGRLAEAVAAGRRAVAADPSYAIGHFNLAVTLADSGEFDEAIIGFQRTITLDPTWADAHFGLAGLFLSRGEYALGWHEFEWRWRMKVFDWIKPYRILEKPRWGGEDISDKTILICAEQGLGDTIQFVRYVRDVVARAKRVILWVQPGLTALLRCVEGVTLLGMNNEPPGFDVYCPLLSLPRVFKTDVASIPSQTPYLRAEPERVRKWKDRLGPHGFKIGVAWKGSKVGTSIGKAFALAEFFGVSQLPNVRLISLQKNDGVEQLRDLPAGMQVETLGDDFDAGDGAFLDAAAVMENLDLVISVDTSIAHLAGALDRPVWVVLKRVADWRWGVGGAETPWYRSMRLFRQNVAGEWGGVFAEIAQAVAARVSEAPGEKATEALPPQSL